MSEPLTDDARGLIHRRISLCLAAQTFEGLMGQRCVKTCQFLRNLKMVEAKPLRTKRGVSFSSCLMLLLCYFASKQCLVITYMYRLVHVYQYSNQTKLELNGSAPSFFVEAKALARSLCNLGRFEEALQCKAPPG